jgi:hypothetical protein
MTPSRIRLLCFALLALVAGGLFLAWSQTWFTFGLETGPKEVRGDVAAGALPPLALVSLAMILALALAGTVFRVVLGVLEALVGVGAIAAAAFAMANPLAVSAPALSKAIGISGAGTVDVVRSTAATAWPVLAIIAGALAVLTGLAVAVTARAWPVSGRRFSRTRTEPVADETDPVREWDALTEGDDPTSPSR